MNRKAFVGDETAEILSYEATRHHLPAVNGKHAAPELLREHFANRTPDSIVIPPKNLKGPMINDSINGSPPEKKDSDVSRTLKRISDLNNESDNFPSKRTKKEIPHLTLDSDLEDLEDPTAKRSPLVERIHSSPVKDHSSVVGLNLKIPTDREHAENTIRELRLNLAQKGREIRALKDGLDSLSHTHEMELENVQKTLHREYSRQASEKMRAFRKAAEEKATQSAEEKYSQEIAELKKQIEIEREEKSKLVRACDEYLCLHGF